MSKKKLQNLHQIDGNADVSPAPNPDDAPRKRVKVKNATTLDQIWGDTGLGKYGTHDPAEYKTYIYSLNKSDLQAHAQKVGLLPSDNTPVLLSRLEREFARHVMAFSAPVEKKAKGKASAAVLKILSEGR